MKQKHSEEFERFDKTMGALLAVPYSELQAKLEKENGEKVKQKKKRATSPASSVRASSGSKKRVA